MTITPYVCVMGGVNGLPWSATNEGVFGDQGGSSNNQGGIIGNTTGSVRSLVFDYTANFMNDLNYQPNNTVSSSVGFNPSIPPTQPGAPIGGGFYDELQMPIGIFETSPTQISGWCGWLDFVRYAFNMQNFAIKSDFTRCYAVSNNNTQTTKTAFPWDTQNRTLYKTGITRTGVTFIRPPLQTPQ